MTSPLCEPHRRAGISVPAEHSVDGEHFCSRCFSGAPIPGFSSWIANPQAAARDSCRRRVQARILDRIKKVFEARSTRRIGATALANMLSESEPWPWRLTDRRLRWILLPLGIRPEVYRVNGAIVKEYKLESFAGVACSGGETEDPRERNRVLPPGQTQIRQIRERAKAGQLTWRQTEVCELVKAGLQDKEIAAQLGISVSGVKFHVAAIYRKMDLGCEGHSRRYRLIAGAESSANRVKVTAVRTSGPYQQSAAR
jgi:DNA-binding CsgD family transcriptional regulator